jgi:hypothetical protein
MDTPMKYKIYITEDGVNLYDLFSAGVQFARKNRNNQWREEEWYEALEAALPKEFIENLQKQK